MKKFTADFETATWNPKETWVWAWAVSEISDKENVKIGNDIESFFELLFEEKNPIVYFHNLKFDGEFLIYYLLKNGYSVVENKKEIRNKTFTCLISDLGQFYSIVVYKTVGNKSSKKITFYDSLKIIPFSVDQVSKAFGLEESKLSIDYNEPREKRSCFDRR